MASVKRPNDPLRLQITANREAVQEIRHPLRFSRLDDGCECNRV